MAKSKKDEEVKETGQSGQDGQGGQSGQVDTVQKKVKLESVEHWANQMLLKPWELAGMRENAKIKPGKLLSMDDFKKLLSDFRNKPLGG